MVSRIAFGGSGETTQPATFYPALSGGSTYRAEAEVTAQAAMSARLALKIGYLVRYSNLPVPGFRSTDTMPTASVVLRWRSIASVAGG